MMLLIFSLVILRLNISLLLCTSVIMVDKGCVEQADCTTYSIYPRHNGKFIRTSFIRQTMDLMMTLAFKCGSALSSAKKYWNVGLHSSILWTIKLHHEDQCSVQTITEQYLKDHAQNYSSIFIPKILSRLTENIPTRKIWTAQINEFLCSIIANVHLQRDYAFLLKILQLIYVSCTTLFNFRHYWD